MNTTTINQELNLKGLDIFLNPIPVFGYEEYEEFEYKEKVEEGYRKEQLIIELRRDIGQELKIVSTLIS